MDTKAVILFFNISGGELLIILLVVLIIFGPGKIPEMARFLGKTINDLRNTTSDITRELRKETHGLGAEIHNAVIKPLNNTVQSANQTTTANNISNTNDETIPDIYLKTEEQNAGSDVPAKDNTINSEGSVISDNDNSYPAQKNE